MTQLRVTVLLFSDERRQIEFARTLHRDSVPRIKMLYWRHDKFKTEDISKLRKLSMPVYQKNNRFSHDV